MGGRGLFISSAFVGGGGLIEAGDLLEMGDLFNLEKTMASVLHKELEQKVEKLKNKERWRSCSRRSESNPNFQLVNKPRISLHEVLQLWLINTVYHLLVKNK